MSVYRKTEKHSPLGHVLGDVLVLHGELNEVLSVVQVLVDGHIVHPRLESFVEKLEPFVANVKDERVAQKQVLETKAGGHAAKVKQILVLTMVLEFELFGGLGAQRVRLRLPRLILRVLGVDEIWSSTRQEHERVAFVAGARAAKQRLVLLLQPRPLFRFPFILN